MNLEVILKGPVRGLGAEADLVKVRPGYARNFLFPNGLAAPVSAASKRQLEALKKRRAEREASEAAEAEEKASRLARVVLNFELKQAEEGAAKLFGSITTGEIASALAEKGFVVEKRDIDLSKVLNQVGDHEVTVHLGYAVKSVVKVKISGKTEDTADRVPRAKKSRKSEVEEEGLGHGKKD
jgi:large subunit ribosomal protein L9